MSDNDTTGSTDSDNFTGSQGSHVCIHGRIHIGGSTPLNLAVMQNADIKMIKFLVEAGADLETTDNKGMTPFLWAVRNANKECIEYLVDSGANTQVTNNGGQTALHICAADGKLFFE